MRIVQQTPTYLKLQERKLAANLWKLAIGIPFLLSGLACIGLMAEKVKLTCDRATPTDAICELSTQTVLNTRKVMIPHLKGAAIESRTPGQQGTYQVILLTSKGQIPFARAGRFQQEEQQARADEINVFLGGTDPSSLTLEQDSRGFAYALGALFIAMGGTTLVSCFHKGHPDTCIIDKRTKQIRWQKTLSGSSLERRDLNIQDVQEVRVFKTREMEGDRPYMTRLVLHSGEMLPLLSGYGQQEQLQLASTLNRFLGIRPQPRSKDI